MASTFVVCNPYAILHFSEFRADLALQGKVAARDKIGGGNSDGFRYYLSTFGWGFGYLASFAALAGGVWLWFRDRRLFWVLIPVLPLFFIYMALRARHFGRWMLPTYPILCMLASYTVWRLVELVPSKPAELGAEGGRDRGGGRCCWRRARSSSSTTTSSSPRATPTTRPAPGWSATSPRTSRSWSSRCATTSGRGRGRTRSTSSSRSRPTSARTSTRATSSPELLPIYRKRGYCWVVASSQFWAPYLDDADQAPSAAAYYRALERQATPVFKSSPWGGPHAPGAPGEDEVGYNPDLSFNFYALPYRRPGPMVVVYRLHGGKCGPKPAPGTKGLPASGGIRAPVAPRPPLARVI